MAVPPEQLPPGEPLHALIGDHWRVVFPEGARGLAEEIGWRITENYQEQPWAGRYTLVLNDTSVDANRTVAGKIQPLPWTTFQWTGTQTFALPTGRPSLVVAEWGGQTDNWSGLLRRDLGRRRAWEGAWGLGASLTWPAWYIEARTLGLEGGDSPGLRATVGTGERDLRPMSFDTAILGSFKRAIPGPRLVGRLLAEPDPAAARAAGDIATGPLILVPGSLSFAWRAKTGAGLRRSWREALADVAPSQRQPLGERIPVAGSGPAPAAIVSPIVDGDGVVVFRYGLGDTGSIGRISADGAWTSLARTGPRVQERIGAGGGRVVWDEVRPDVRFAGRSRSVLRLREPDGRVRDLAVGRLSSPALSPDGRRVAAVWQSQDGRSLLIEIDVETGRRLRMFGGDGELWLAPRYATDGESLCALRRGEAGTSVVRVGGAAVVVVGPTPATLVDPACTADEVVYSVDGELFSTGADGTRSLGSTASGAWSPAIGADSLWFVTPGPEGSALYRALWPITGVPVPDFAAVGVVRGRGPQPWTEKRVIRFAHLFDFHGSSLSTPTAMTDTGITGQVWDVTGSAMFYGDLVLDTNEGTPKVDLQFRWFALPVRLGVTGRAGLRHYVGDGHVAGAEGYLGLNAGIPINLSRGLWSRTADLDVGVGEVVTRPWKLPFTQGEHIFPTQTFPIASVTATVAQSRLQAPRQVLPRWSQRVQGWYTQTDRGRYMAAQLAITLPAFGRDQGFLLQAAAAHDTIRDWRPALPFRFARGYLDVDQDGLWRLSADWRFPLAYPDLTLGPAYITRVKGAVFVDYAQGTRGRYRSVGVELVADTSLLHLAPLDIGARLLWRLDRPGGLGGGPIFSWRY